MKIKLLIAGAVLMTSPLLYAASSGGYAGSTSNFTVTQTTDIPGSTLKPGDYTINIVDQLSDRMIVRVDSVEGKEHAIFLGVPHTDLPETGAPGPVSWKASPRGTNALRGFEFSPGTTVEFVYPKAQAAALAKLNEAKVVAVDPESEGRPTLKKMSQDDMQVVGLWMLSLTTTGADHKTPAMLAQKYEPDAATRAVVASNAAARASHAAATTERASLEPPPAPAHVASAKRQHVVAQLPHTASLLPLIVLLGFFSLFSAAALRFVRFALGRRAAQ